MRCLWAEESSALRRTIKQVVLIKAGLAQLKELATQIQAMQVEQGQRIRILDERFKKEEISGSNFISHGADIVQDGLQSLPDEQTILEAEPNRCLPERKKVKFLVELEQQIEKMSICDNWEQDGTKANYLANIEITNRPNSCEHKEIQVIAGNFSYIPHIPHAMCAALHNSMPNEVGLKSGRYQKI